MQFKTFSSEKSNHLEENMFLGSPMNLSRHDVQKYKVFFDLTDKQVSFFWRPEEIDCMRDRSEFSTLSEHEKHIFISNLKYQTLLDSVQARSPTAVLGLICSNPELETFIQSWSFFESIHARSYSHIIRQVFPNPSEVFDSIMIDPAILERAAAVTKDYDDLFEEIVKMNYEKTKPSRELKVKLAKTVCSVNILEGIRFYVSFACSFAFAERGVMEGVAKIIKLIARDEHCHLSATQNMLNIWASGNDDKEMQEIVLELRQTEFREMFRQAIEQEKDWAKHLFKDGSMLGMNAEVLTQFLDYIAAARMMSVGVKPFKQKVSNPIPWIDTWLKTDNVQVAPQETEITSYQVGQIDMNVDIASLGMEL